MKIFKCHFSLKTRPVAAQLLRADGQTDRQTDMKTQVVAFRNFVKASENDGSAAALFMRIGSFSLSVNTAFVKNKVCWLFKNAVSTAGYRLYRF